MIATVVLDSPFGEFGFAGMITTPVVLVPGDAIVDDGWEPVVRVGVGGGSSEFPNWISVV